MRGKSKSKSQSPTMNSHKTNALARSKRVGMSARAKSSAAKTIIGKRSTALPRRTKVSKGLVVVPGK